MASRLPRILALLAALSSFLSSAFAASAKFDIPAQSAPAAIEQFIKQSGVHVAFVVDDLKNVTTNPISGEYESADALRLLLKGTGFVVTEGKPGFFSVVHEESKKNTGSVEGSLLSPPGSGKTTAGVNVMVVETGDATVADKHGQFEFSALAPGTYTLVATGDGFSRLRIEDVGISANHMLTLGAQEMPIIRKDGEIQTMAEFVVHANKDIETMTPYVVTDTSVKPQPFSDRNVDLPRGIDDVQPYYIFNSQQLEESGTTDVEDFLKQRLTMDTTVMTNSQITLYSRVPAGTFTPTYVSSASSINLNGLGGNHTLILVNGLPMAGVSVVSANTLATPGQPDVNGIPMDAIDRIEVLPSSAGAIYGASAEGGVINIILKKAYNGGDITATYGSTWDGYGPSRTLEATFGKSFENGKTQLFVTAQYSDSSPMFVQDRVNLLNRGYAALLNNDPSALGAGALQYTSIGFYYPPVGATPNFGSNTRVNGIAQPLTLKSTGAAVGGANPYIATLPVGYSITSNPSGIIGGQWNLSPGEDNEGPNGLLVPLGNYPRRKSIMATLTRQMTSKLQLHVDFSNNENHSYSDYNPLSTENGESIPASDPYNPFNQSVLVSFPINDNAPATSNTVTRAITLGGTLKLPFDWVAHLDYQWSESSFETLVYNGPGANNPFNYGASTFYGSSSSNTFAGVPDNNPTPLWSGAINPFVDTLAFPINWEPFSESSYYSGQTTSDDVVLAASGPLFHLAWGDPRLSIRLEHNKSGEPGGSDSTEVPATTPYLGFPILNGLAFSSFGQTQTTDSANAELDLPIFKSKLPLLRSLDAQLNFSNETSTNWIGTSGIGYHFPNAYSAYLTGALVLEGPNSIAGGAEPINSYISQSGTITPASGVQPIRTRAVSSNTGFTGPALSYKPTDDVTIRASVASGYVPPTYAQLLPSPLSALTPSITNNLTDPKTGTIVNGVNVYNLGGNSNLQPESSKSWDFGAVWEPHTGFLRGFRADAEFTETKQQNVILAAPGAQTIINLESNYPDLVVRNSSGQITTVYNQAINVAEAKQDAWTFTVDYPWRTAIGNFEFTAAETIQEHNAQQIKTGTQFLEYVGYPNSGGVAKTKATGTLRWAWHNWVAAWTTVFFDGYKQYGAPGDPSAYASQLETNTPVTSLNTTYLLAQGGYAIPSQMYQNLYISYDFRRNPFDRNSRFGRFMDVFMDGMKISFSVNNVLNTVAPFDAYYAPFYTSQFSPDGSMLLRNYQLSVRKAF